MAEKAENATTTPQRDEPADHLQARKSTQGDARQPGAKPHARTGSRTEETTVSLENGSWDNGGELVNTLKEARNAARQHLTAEHAGIGLGHEGILGSIRWYWRGCVRLSQTVQSRDTHTPAEGIMQRRIIRRVRGQPQDWRTQGGHPPPPPSPPPPWPTPPPWPPPDGTPNSTSRPHETKMQHRRRAKGWKYETARRFHTAAKLP